MSSLFQSLLEGKPVEVIRKERPKYTKEIQGRTYPVLALEVAVLRTKCKVCGSVYESPFNWMKKIQFGDITRWTTEVDVDTWVETAPDLPRTYTYLHREAPFCHKCPGIVPSASVVEPVLTTEEPDGQESD